ncbi:hypothetical protein B0T09DRAFT_140318 [Sordaria sp. MPI-SDFR-AT-0083]|nr:hypothetical protein B0T09DRAFT_140318 [Sordaria sp. MPI-SDFR-AT-0083]
MIALVVVAAPRLLRCRISSACNPCPAAKFPISYQRDSTVELDQNPNFFLSSRHLQVLPGVCSFLFFHSIFASSLFTAVLCPPNTLAISPAVCPTGSCSSLFPSLFFSSVLFILPLFFFFLIPLLFIFP